MKNSWSQPSLSRDFALLAAAILFILFLISAWVSYSTFNRHSKYVLKALDHQATRIESVIDFDLENSNYMLTSLGKQIILDRTQNLTSIAQILKSFDSRGYIYSTFSFINPEQQIVVSSNLGVLDKPLDVSDRDYGQLAMSEPWKMHVGTPIEGRVSGRWVVPVSMGITDYTGKHIGSLLISLDVAAITKNMNNLIKDDGLSFAIMSRVDDKPLVKITEITEEKDFIANNFPSEKLAAIDFEATPQALIERGNLFIGSNLYTYYRALKDYPYVILIGYNAYENDVNVRNQLLSRLLQVFGFAIFFVLFLWIMRARLIRPIVFLTEMAGGISKGKAYISHPQGGAEEIESLSLQMGKISDYIAETGRIEDELRNKMFMLKKSKEVSELEILSKTEFLAYICQELRTPINSVIGFAQVMKDQLYGPIENRKYRQCAADIHLTSSIMLDNLTDLLAFSKIKTGYVATEEKPTQIHLAANKAISFLTERLTAANKEFKSSISESFPELIVSHFRLYQIIVNVMKFLLETTESPRFYITAKLFHENKDRSIVAIFFYRNNLTTKHESEILSHADRSIESSIRFSLDQSIIASENINLKLARILLSEHQAGIHIEEDDDGKQVALFFTHNRIHKEPV